MLKLLLLIFFIGNTVFSQNLHQRFDGIPVNIGGQPSNSPFSGGIDIPRYQFVDIDGDNDLDLFINDRDTSLNFYRNTGSVSMANYVLISNKFQNLVTKNWFFFVDIDNDFDKDLFCGGDSQHVRYLKNIGSPNNPVFQFQTFAVQADNGAILSEAACVPVFADIDADGDFDFISGASTGRVTLYENIGNAAGFNYKFITSFWKNLEIIGGADKTDSRFRPVQSHGTYSGNDKMGSLEIIGGANRHGASSITFEDIDGDNDRDLFWGDLFNPSIYFIRNTGTSQNFNYSSIDTNYPIANPWISSGFNMPRIHDIDNDGKKDLFVSVIIGSYTTNNFVYYRNTGTASVPQFTKVTENYIRTIDAGSFSYPCFADIDNDNDMDLFVGSDRPKISFFRNTGTVTAPQFNLEIDSIPINYANIIYTPAIADMNNDGRKDMICGAFDGKLRYYLNTGTVQNPVFTFTASGLDAIDIGQSSMPCLFDMDNDGDKDMVIGNSDGKLYYYVNNGSVNSFNFQLVTNNYFSIFAGNDSAPSIGDIDNDNDPDMLIGNRQGVLYLALNNGTIGAPNFNLLVPNYAQIKVGYESTPAIVDINGDSDKDVFIGNAKGGVYYYENWDVFGIKQISSEVPAGFSLGQNYPNPFNPKTVISFQLTVNSFTSLKIFDAAGREVSVLISQYLKPGEYEVDFEAGNFPSGVYFYQLTVNVEQSAMYRDTKKMVLIK